MKKESNISFFERMINDTMELDWSVPQEFPDLTNSKFIAIDLRIVSDLCGVTPCIRLEGKIRASPAVNLGSKTLVKLVSLANW